MVISMMPHSLHYLIALDCIEFGKHLLTASYVSDEIKQLEPAINSKKLLFLCEMGLDPGIDHMSAMQLFHRIKDEGGKIISFKSHCGGLVAPESDDNPWHYKISWNPRNIILAGKAGAVYKENNKVVHLNYEELFNSNHLVHVPECGMFSFYPNRDSMGYIDLYELHDTKTFIRTTLRHPDFSFGWKNIVDLKLTDEELTYNTNGMTVATFFKNHFEKHGVESVALKMQQTNLGMKQFTFIGINDETLINKGLCSAADVLQFILEIKLALQPEDKDMIVMMHEITYELNGMQHNIQSSLVVKGENSLRTAMAKTVGLPLGIAARLILEGKIMETGLHIPVKPIIYEPVLEALKDYGIIFHEKISTI
ncbi:MAG: saccharopine dehydrogenase C-terminal domain-containing protein [Panacibacter sp.]